VRVKRDEVAAMLESERANNRPANGLPISAPERK